MTNDHHLEFKDSFFLRLTYSFIRLTLGTLVRTIWVKEVHGLENIPKKGAAIVAFNHQSFFDFLCFVSVSPRHIHFLSAEKFFSHLLWAPLMIFTSQIKVVRTQKDKRILHNTIYSHLKHGKLIGIFPEGTRSPHEHEMILAFTGVAKYAINGAVPIIPVGIKGTYNIMAKHDKVPKFHKVAKIFVGKPIDFHNKVDVKLNEKAYRMITDKVMMEISKLSDKNYKHSGISK